MQRCLFNKKIIVFLVLTLLFSTNCRAENVLAEYLEKASHLLEKTSPEAILDTITSGLISSTKAVSKSTFLCFSVLTAGAFFSIFGSFNSSSEIYSFLSTCLITLSVFTPICACFEKAGEYIEALCAFMLAFIPTGAILESACGATLSSALLSTSGKIWVAGLETISAAIILPITKAAFSLISVNQFCKKANIASLHELLKSWCLWILGLSFTIFSGIMTLQGVLQNSADTLAMKGLRYSAAKLIPVAGGLVSESMKNVIQSMSYIKSVSGVSGIVSIVYLLLPPLLFILVTKFSLALLSSFSFATNQKETGAYLKNASGILNLLLALLISLCLAFIILFTIFMRSTPSI